MRQGEPVCGVVARASLFEPAECPRCSYEARGEITFPGLNASAQQRRSEASLSRAPEADTDDHGLGSRCGSTLLAGRAISDLAGRAPWLIGYMSEPLPNSASPVGPRCHRGRGSVRRSDAVPGCSPVPRVCRIEPTELPNVASRPAKPRPRLGTSKMRKRRYRLGVAPGPARRRSARRTALLRAAEAAD